MILRLIVLVGSIASLADAQGPLRFELKQLERKTPNCVITIEYPEIVSAATPQARDRINAGIRRVLLQHTEWPERDSGLPSVDGRPPPMNGVSIAALRASDFGDL